MSGTLGRPPQPHRAGPRRGPSAATPAEPEVPEGLVADVFARSCPSRRTVETLASKWGILALVALTEGTYRFNALRRRVDGVSEKMLAQTLHALERDGLVTREVQAAIPPRVEYTLTDFGQAAADTLTRLIDLVEARTPQVEQARAAYDARTSSRNGPPG
jgi:DNA-binding HxlR family transcriptional regulator